MGIILRNACSGTPPPPPPGPRQLSGPSGPQKVLEHGCVSIFEQAAPVVRDPHGHHLPPGGSHPHSHARAGVCMPRVDETAAWFCRCRQSGPRCFRCRVSPKPGPSRPGSAPRWGLWIQEALAHRGWGRPCPMPSGLETSHGALGPGYRARTGECCAQVQCFSRPGNCFVPPDTNLCAPLEESWEAWRLHASWCVTA